MVKTQVITSSGDAKKSNVKNTPFYPETKFRKIFFEYHENHVKEIEKKEGKLPKGDPRLVPNLLVPVCMEMLAYNIEQGKRFINAMWVDPIAKSLILFPLYKKALMEQYRSKNVSIVDVCIVADAKNLKKVEGQEPAEVWLRKICHEKLGIKYTISKKARAAKEAMIENIVGICRFKGNEIYLNERFTARIFSLEENEAHAKSVKKSAEPNNGLGTLADAKAVSKPETIMQK